MKPPRAGAADRSRRRRRPPVRAAPPLEKPSWQRRIEPHVWWIAPALPALAAHVTALTAGYVWLDLAHIEEGLAIEPPARFHELFTRGFAGTGYYRPLMALSLSVDSIAGAAWVHHADSLAWHAAAAVMVAVAAVHLGLEKRVAALAGALFAVHPATTLVASSIAFRSEAMLAVCLLGLIAAHRASRPVLAGAALLGGALVKETALVLGPLLVLALELVDRRPGSRSKRLIAAEVAALAVAVSLRMAFAPPWRAEHAALSPSEALGTRAASLSRAAETMILPLDRSICDAFPVTAMSSPRALAGLLVAAVLGWAAWRLRGAALLLALSLLPALQIAPVMRWWSPHYVYVPLAFAAMLVATAIGRSQRPRAMQLAIAAAVLLGMVSLVDGRRYANDESLWRPEIEARPACKEGHFYLGEAARASGRWAEAEARYRDALADWPGMLAYVDRAAVLANLGTVELEQRDLPEARSAFTSALEVTAEPAMRRKLTHNLAAVALASGDPAEALRLLEPEIARADALPESLYLAAKSLHALGREEETRRLIARLQRLGWSGERSR